MAYRLRLMLTICGSATLLTGRAIRVDRDALFDCYPVPFASTHRCLTAGPLRSFGRVNITLSAERRLNLDSPSTYVFIDFEKVTDLVEISWEINRFEKEQSFSKRNIINLSGFCLAAIIIPSIFTLSNPLKRWKSLDSADNGSNHALRFHIAFWYASV